MSKYKYYLTREARLDGSQGLCEVRSVETGKEVRYQTENRGGVIEPKEVKALIDFYAFNGWISTIMGKILTVIDTSITDERQNKAMKDTLKEVVFNYTHGHIKDMFMGHPERLLKHLDCSSGENEEASIRPE